MFRLLKLYSRLRGIFVFFSLDDDFSANNDFDDGVDDDEVVQVVHLVGCINLELRLTGLQIETDSSVEESVHSGLNDLLHFSVEGGEIL